MASTEPEKTQTQAASTPGAESLSCPSCGKPMAADQRYCLNCGHRRAEPRVDFREHLFAGGPASDNGLVRTQSSRGWNPLAAAALLGLLGIMLLVGVLIGKDENDEPASTTPPAQTTPTTGAVAPTAPATPPAATAPTAPAAPTATAPTATTPSAGADAKSGGAAQSGATESEPGIAPATKQVRP